MLLTYNFQLIFDTVIYLPCCSIDFRTASTSNGWQRKLSVIARKYLDFLQTLDKMKRVMLKKLAKKIMKVRVKNGI